MRYGCTSRNRTYWPDDGAPNLIKGMTIEWKQPCIVSGLSPWLASRFLLCSQFPNEVCTCRGDRQIRGRTRLLGGESGVVQKRDAQSPVEQARAGKSKRVIP